MNDDELMNQVSRKIEREKSIINAANIMRQSSNPQVQASLDSQVREARRGIAYLEERMRELEMRKMGQGKNAQSTLSASGGAPLPPAHGGLSPQRVGRNTSQIAPPIPPKDGGIGYTADGGGYGDPGAGGYMNDLSGGHGMMPPRPPFEPPAPGSAASKTRSNGTKLGRSTPCSSDQSARLNGIYRSYQIRIAIYSVPDPAYAISIRI